MSQRELQIEKPGEEGYGVFEELRTAQMAGWLRRERWQR